MAFVEVAGLKLRVRCHSEAPGCLIFHRVIPALWIGLIALSRPLLCTYPHALSAKFLITKLLYLSQRHSRPLMKPLNLSF